VLFMVGWVFIGAGLQSLTPVEPMSHVQQQATRFLMAWVPEPVWGWAFIAFALLCWSAMLIKRLEPTAFGVSAGLWALWAFGYAVAIYGSDHPVTIFRGSITNLVISIFVVIASTWRENWEVRPNAGLAPSALDPVDDFGCGGTRHLGSPERAGQPEGGDSVGGSGEVPGSAQG
jgi:hypothetical protein